MRITDSYISKLKRSAGLCLAMLCPFLLPSCAEDGDITPETAEGGTCKATISLNVASFGQSGQADTRYVEGFDDEKIIRNIWVFQYNANTGKSMKEPVYLDNFDSNNIQVDLASNTGGEKSRVYIVANINDEWWALDEVSKTIKEEFNTYEKLVAHALPDATSAPFLGENLGENGKTIPMFGVSETMAIVPQCYVSIPLVRTFARLVVKVDPSYPHQVGMELANLTVSNIPAYCQASSVAPAEGDSEAATYPATVTWSDFDAGKVEELHLYVPENLQGKVAGMTSKQTAAEGFPEKALAVKVTMSYTKDGAPLTHTYTVYPGLDMTNDFNIKRNYIYNVNIKITKLPE